MDVVLYAEDPVYNEILEKLVKETKKEMHSDLIITKKTKEELGLKQGDNEVKEIEALRGEKKNVLCVIKGIIKNREALEQALEKLSEKEPGIPPILVFEDGDKAGPYSLLKALESVIDTERIVIDWPPVGIEEIEKEYKEYKKSLQELSGA